MGLLKMMFLFHQSFDPLSRFIRLALYEFQQEFTLIDENIHARREEFLILNPACAVPMLLVDEVLPLAFTQSIAEFLQESFATPHATLLPEHPIGRAEVRRLTAWFNEKFYKEVSQPFLHEMIEKRFLTPEQGGGAPEMNLLRAARHNIKYHLSYIDWLMQKRSYLAGEALSFADLAAAAHLSVLDYFSDVPWAEAPHAKLWYARIKSRPAFRALLSERVVGMPPAAHYADLDF
jgi:glutathione S-transferase